MKSLDVDKTIGQPPRMAITGKQGTISLLLLTAYLVAKPFYFLPSGTAQIGDFVIALLFVLTFLGRQGLAQGAGPVLWTCVLFATYTLIVNAVWAGLLADLSMLITPVFYFFNATIVYVILTNHAKTGKRLLRTVLAGVVLSAMLQVLLSLAFLASGQERQTLFFNNPNQLGYWGLLSATIFCLLANHVRLRLAYQLPVLAILAYMVAISLSKAAIIAFLLLNLIHFSRKFSHFILVSALGVVLFLLLSDLPLFEDVVARLRNIGQQSDDSLAGRGYDRIWRFPQYLILGAGEGALYRFGAESGLELHSTFGAVFFSYGIVGLLLFGLLLWQLLSASNWPTILYLLPAFLYGTTHQGLRFSFLWVLFAVIAALGNSAATGETASTTNRGGRSARPSRPPGRLPRSGIS